MGLFSFLGDIANAALDSVNQALDAVNQSLETTPTTFVKIIVRLQEVTEKVKPLDSKMNYDISITGDYDEKNFIELCDVIKHKNSLSYIKLNLSELRGLNEIPESAFESCLTICSVILPDTVKIIGKKAFENCSKLTVINIPNSVTDIFKSAFNGCKKLKDLDCHGCVMRDDNGIGEIDVCVDIDTAIKMLEKLDDETIIYTFTLVSDVYDKDKIDKIITSIKNNTIVKAFSLNLKNINGMTEVFDNQFEGLENICHISLPNTVTRIGKKAFANCNHLMKIEIPPSVNEVAGSAFDGCTLLEELSIPEDIIQHEYSYIEIKLDDAEEIIDELEEGYYHINIIGTYTSDLFESLCDAIKYNAYAKLEIDLSHLKSLSEIPEDAFKSAENIHKIILPDTINKISKGAFSGCKFLKTINIPNSVTEIADAVFMYTGLENLVIDKKKSMVKRIGKSSFTGSKIKSLVLPDTVQVIDEEAFSDCDWLESLFIGNNIKSISPDAFKYEPYKYDTSRGCTVAVPRKCTLDIYIEKEKPPKFAGEYHYESATRFDHLVFHVPLYLYEKYESSFGGIEIKIEYIELEHDIEYELEPMELSISDAIQFVKKIEPEETSVLHTLIITGEVSNEELLLLANEMRRRFRTQISLDLSKVETLKEINGFEDCECLVSIKLPQNLRVIGDNAFRCTSIESITLPAKIREIDGAWIFAGCEYLEKITLLSPIPPKGFFDLILLDQTVDLCVYQQFMDRYVNTPELNDKEHLRERLKKQIRAIPKDEE